MDATSTAAGKATAGADSEALYDLQSALNRLDGDRELFGKLAEFFHEDAPQLLDRIRAAVAANQAREVERAAHSLKSLAANFSANAASSAAWQIEELARGGNLEKAANLLPEVASQVQKLREALSRYLAESNS
jgi:HPt (histidine-containing phosphotransfer) domain-containing protein